MTSDFSQNKRGRRCTTGLSNVGISAPAPAV